MIAFGNQVHEYLQQVHADVEYYKFTIEQSGEEFEMELHFKAYVHPGLSVKPEVNLNLPEEAVD